jgi:hypothetical protein
MKKTLCWLVLVSAVLASCGASGKGELTAVVPGLSAATASKLNGVWEDTRLRDTQAARDKQRTPQTFSWGKAGIIVNASAFVDFGANPPVISLPAIGDFSPFTARERSGASIEFEAKNIVAEGTMNKATIQINFYSGDVIGISATVNGEVFTEFKYYRVYGPATS